MSEFIDSNGWSIGLDLFKYVTENYPSEKYPRLLEFGTGASSKEWIEAGYIYMGVEQDFQWYNKAKKLEKIYYTIPRIVYAPIINGWYDSKVVMDLIESENEIDIIVVDGPTKASGGRAGILKHVMDLNASCYIFDDLNRQDDLEVATAYSQALGLPLEIHGTGTKQFGVIKCTK